MAEVTISNSPVHSDSIITYPYGIVDYSYECDFHTGLDFAPYGSTGTNPDIYPCFAGEVVEVSTTGSLGYRVVIKDAQNRFWRYCHMVAGSITVSVGQQVTTGTKLGNMGMTGNATRNPPSFRMVNYASLELFNIFKSCFSFSYSKCKGNYCTL